MIFGDVLEKQRGVEYRELGARDLLNRLNGSPLPFGWTVNPFRGCRVGCTYCYARYTHEFLGHADPAEFERTIYVKQVGDASLLDSLRRARKSDLEVAIGTATDPYQPVEAKFGITRQVLEAARRVPGLALGITTKSTLVTRDLDLLLEIARHSRLWVNFSVITLDAQLTRRLEPRAPRPDLRLRALEKLARAGIATRLFVMPILPWLTDGDETLRPLLEAARRAGCREARWNVLFLRSGTRELFLKLIEEEFPWLTERYQMLYARSPYVPGEYRDEVERRISAHARAVGLALPALEEPASAPSARSSSRPRQLSLVW
jgi:DNA repair photolyase